jgi:hypothetical protein
VSRSLSESPSAPFKAMLSHNRPRHIRLANAAVSSNFVWLQSRWARYLKSSSPSPKMSTKDRGEVFLRSSLAYLATAKNSKNGSCCAHCARGLGGPSAEARRRV